jgi:hypothetical protein
MLENQPPSAYWPDQLDRDWRGFSWAPDSVRATLGSGASGNSIQNVEPLLSCDSTPLVPPWAEAIDATIASPRPLPPDRRDRPLSTR